MERRKRAMPLEVSRHGGQSCSDEQPYSREGSIRKATRTKALGKAHLEKR